MNWGGEFGHSNLKSPRPTIGLLGVCSAYAMSHGGWFVQTTRVSVADDFSAKIMHENTRQLSEIAVNVGLVIG